MDEDMNGADSVSAASEAQGQLWRAVKRGDLALAKLALEAGAKADLPLPLHSGSKDGEVIRPSQIAAGLGNLEMLKLLANSGSDMFALGETNASLLSKAASSNRLDVMEWLIDLGLNLDLADVKGSTAMHAAAGHGHASAAKLLVERGAAKSVRNSQGRDALMMACSCGSVETVSYLLAAGADANGRDASGATLLMIAAKSDRRACAELLIPMSDLEARDEQNCTALMWAAMGSQKGTLARKLVEAGADPWAVGPHGETAMELSAADGNADAAAFFANYGIKLGLDSEAWKARLARALSAATIRPPGNLAAKTVEGLLLAGAEPNRDARTGEAKIGAESMLCLALIRGRLDVAGTLRRHGASVDAPDVEGDSPLHLLARGGSLAPIELLLSWGADPLSANRDGLLPSQIAVAREEGERYKMIKAAEDRARETIEIEASLPFAHSGAKPRL